MSVVEGAVTIAAQEREVTHSEAAAASRRIDSIDLLRGIVMVIMMLDHTRDFFHWAALRFDPTDLSKASVALFLTRWITHFCAPVFVFLAGTSAGLQLIRGKSRPELTRFLVTRGLWLIFIEVTVIQFAVTFNFDLLGGVFVQVIWAIGWSMIFLALVIHLPPAAMAAAGVAMIVFHNAFDTLHPASWRPGQPLPSIGHRLWLILHEQGLVAPFGENGPVIFVVYPLIPWLGVMAAGCAFAYLWRLDEDRRRRIILTLGLTMTAAFVALRFTNWYGDPHAWSVQKNATYTLLSFLNTTKYPPSLLFLLMTLGPSLVALSLFERTRSAIARPLVTFGRVPMFFYILQWLTAHTFALLFTLALGRDAQHLYGGGRPAENAGYGLDVTYVAWIVGVLLLYPLCAWFARVKARRRDWWLSYL